MKRVFANLCINLLSHLVCDSEGKKSRSMDEEIAAHEKKQRHNYNKNNHLMRTSSISVCEYVCLEERLDARERVGRAAAIMI